MDNRNLITGILLLVFICAQSILAGETEELFYAIEQNNEVCGYAHAIIKQTERDDRPCIHLIDSIWMQMSALGKSLEGKYLFEYLIDPADGNYFYHTSSIEQGSMKMQADMRVLRDTIFITSELEKDTTVVGLPPGTILQNTRIHRHLTDFFVNDTITEKECQIFSEVDGTINDMTYTLLGREKLELVGTSYDALIVEALNRTTGIRNKMWIDAVSGLLLKTAHPIRNIYLTDASVREKVKRADLDEHLFARVNEIISNPWALSYMKVRGNLQPSGVWMTKESLNVRGQSFEGTVVDNQIDGVFEISHELYDGTNSPSFPCDFSGIDSLQAYLQPSEMIESDEAVLISKAEEITVGSKDAWEAVTRLSRWVHDEIGYDLPGGVTALKTFETRLGECGSHSNLLAAFCRAAGIPARCVFGCMYVPNHGGAFGQHAWNEAYMGEAGWIPIDCTVEEITYVDCGHIRLGEWISKAIMFNPDTMELIEYRVGEGSYADLGKSESAQQYNLYVGQYQGPENILTILVQDESLALDIPGRMVFELKDPDDKGQWFFKLTGSVCVSFDQDDAGNVTALTIDSRQRLPKNTDDDSTVVESDVPEKYREQVGVYVIPMRNMEFRVMHNDSGLTLSLPGPTTVPLVWQEKKNLWISDFGSGIMLAVSFDKDDSGEVSAMLFSELSVCPKIE